MSETGLSRQDAQRPAALAAALVAVYGPAEEQGYDGEGLMMHVCAEIRAVRRAGHRMGRFAAVAVVCFVACGSGCVQRRMTIRSDPPGALVYVDDYQIGTTPVSTDFVYYGTRKIRLVKDGYETLTVRQPFPIPWYEIFPLDFVAENLVPWEIRDERVVDLAMTTTAATPAESVIARAERVRLAAGSLPAPPPQPVASPALVQPMPAPPPAVPQPLPAPGGALPPSTWSPGLQPPLRNAPMQGVPGL